MHLPCCNTLPKKHELHHDTSYLSHHAGKGLTQDPVHSPPKHKLSQHISTPSFSASQHCPPPPTHTQVGFNRKLKLLETLLNTTVYALATLQATVRQCVPAVKVAPQYGPTWSSPTWGSHLMMMQALCTLWTSLKCTSPVPAWQTRPTVQ
jgi:hypothetical protein